MCGCVLLRLDNTRFHTFAVTRGFCLLKRCRLTGIWIPIINLRGSDDRLRFIMGISIPIRQCPLNEKLPWNIWENQSPATIIDTSTYRGRVWYENAHSTTITMKRLLSDFPSRTTPHTSSVRASYEVSCVSYTCYRKKNDRDISTAHCTKH